MMSYNWNYCLYKECVSVTFKLRIYLGQNYQLLKQLFIDTVTTT